MSLLIWEASSALLIAAVLAIRAVFRERMSAGFRYALWAVVLIRLLVPFTVFKSPVSLGGAIQKTEVGGAIESVSGLKSVSQSRTGVVTGVTLAPIGAVGAGEVVIMPGAAPESVPGLQKTIRVRDVMNVVRLTGMGLAVGYFIMVNAGFYLRLRRRRSLLSVNAPCRVYAVQGIESSCLFMNAVYVSKETAENPEALRCVLAHELSHRRHGDPVFALLRCVSLVLHWFDPFVWIAAFVSRRDSELFADAGAIKMLGEEKREDYGKTLIELTVKPRTEANIICTATAMTNGRSELRARIRSIAFARRTRAAAAAAALVFALAAAGCAFIGSDKKPMEYSPGVTDETAGVGSELYVPEDASDAWFAEEAWKLANEICAKYGLKLSDNEFTVKVWDDWNVSTVRFGKDEKHPVEITFTENSNGVKEIAGCSLIRYAEDAWDDRANIEAGIRWNEPNIMIVTKDNIEWVRSEKEPGADDLICAVRYAAEAETHTLIDTGSVLRCTGAVVLSVERVKNPNGGKEKYAVRYAVMPADSESFIASEYGMYINDLYTESEHPEAELWLVLKITAQAAINSDGSITVDLRLPVLDK